MMVTRLMCAYNNIYTVHKVFVTGICLTVKQVNMLFTGVCMWIHVLYQKLFVQVFLCIIS